MPGRTITSALAVVITASGLVGCEKIESMLGKSAGVADFRNAQVDVGGTSCSDGAKLSTLVLQDGRYQLGSYQFSLLGDVKHGDVFGHTQEGTPAASVFIGNCVADGQTSQVLFVYGSDEDGRPTRLAADDLSDDSGAAQGFDVKDGTIVVDEAKEGKPSEITYALLNGKMTNLTTGSTSEAVDAGTSGMDTVSFQIFHDKLQPYGAWIDHPRWGQVWHPAQSGFRPYENGHWEDSDEYGTVWVSNDSWGGETTHYGRWAYDSGYGGWLWVPGYVWGPSWVIWRASDQYVGWFPMPPGAYDGEGDFVDDWASWYGYRAWYPGFNEAAFDDMWSFVAPDDVYDVDVRARIVDRRGYRRFIGRSRAWTHYGIAHGHIFSHGLDKARFREAFHHDAPGSHHDFKGGRMTSVKQGHAIASRERGNEHERSAAERGGAGGRRMEHAGGMSGHRAPQSIGHNGMSGGHFSNGGPNGISHSRNGFAQSGGGGAGRTGFTRSGGGSNGLGRSGGFPHTNGFSRSAGGGPGGISRQSGGGGSGFTRTGGGGNGLSGFNHNAGGGLGGFGNAGHSIGGAMQQHPSFGGSHPAAPHPSSGGGGGGSHHH